jgi:hypothetical protein
MQDPPSDKREVDMWYVAAGCLALAGVLSGEGGLLLAGLFLLAGRAVVTGRVSGEAEGPIDSHLRARRLLIGIAVGLFVLAVALGPPIKDKNCPSLRGASDYINLDFTLIHFASCWFLWRNFSLDVRRKVAAASLVALAVALIANIFRPNWCERYEPRLVDTILEWLLYLVDVVVCIVALSRSREERIGDRLAR